MKIWLDESFSRWIRKLDLHCRVIKRGYERKRGKERGRKKIVTHIGHASCILASFSILQIYTVPGKSIHTFPLFTIRAKVVSKGERACISASSWSHPPSLPSLLFSRRQFMLSNIAKFGFGFRVVKMRFYMILRDTRRRGV